MIQKLLLLSATLLGSVAPDFSLFTPDGRAWKLSEMLVDRPVVLLNAAGCTETIQVPDTIRLVALRPSICGGYRDHTGAARRFLGDSRAALIDKLRVVRLAAGEDLESFTAAVAKWRPDDSRGVNCLLCHRSDRTAGKPGSVP